MTITEFQAVETADQSWSAIQKSLWHDSKGDWQKAHDLIDHLDTSEAAHVHAYLHRKEGDLWNAQYWYNRANQPLPNLSLDAEWAELFKLYV
ncbi:hypothetical protein HX021_09655 [Sphingobacterium sp. N143]|uniref:hypothetical protein n=1 Tax=Sphingobacterium sp. N143 TaxID=2746727 RepID=UPI002578BE4E|nr:hypothetical protein [Sphingobacterium sp. N143]MDM1294556.1 hypothetical protein [Sphingobacterium sp. N143]